MSMGSMLFAQFLGGMAKRSISSKEVEVVNSLESLN